LTADWSDGGEPLGVRRRTPGDRLRVAGLEGAKKLQDLLVDAHVPRDRRDLLPVVTAGESVVWVAGVRRAAWRADLPESARLLRLTVTPVSPETAALVADQRRGYL
jgi:tRNA(Ile)-lysidine synthase